METLFSNRSSTAIRMVFGSLAILATLAFAQPQAAQAAGTSGGATIYNTVKVTYQSGITPLFATANVSVTVNTLAALPTVTNPANQTTVSGALVTYQYIIKSNSNGPDTYTTSLLANVATNITGPTGPSVTASVPLWGGIALGSGLGTITVPFGTTTGLVAGVPGVGSTVQIGLTNTYTVTAINPGSAASTIAGNLVPEAPATLTLSPIGASTAITAGFVSPGTQVGEFKNTLTAALTTGTPTIVGTDGTYSTTFSVTTGALPVALTLPVPAVITTVASPAVTITKTSNAVAGKVDPGATITYTITVRNTHATVPVNTVSVIDPVPAYTTYVASSTHLNGITVAGDGAVSPLIAGLAVDNNVPVRAPGAVATGILPAAGVAVITYQVTVQ